MSESPLTEVFASFVPKLILKRVIENPAPIDSPLAEEFRAAVLFADISGFTALTEQLAERGPTGVETLARILNDYFGQLMDTIHDYGGDVVKFAGDALIAIWPLEGAAEDVSPDAERQWTLRAAECALEIHDKLLDYETQGSKLYLKLALSTGRVWQSHIGGVFNRWEFVLVGDPLVDVGIANNYARAGDIILTASAWNLIREDCQGVPFEIRSQEKTQAAARLKSLKRRSPLPAERQPFTLPNETQAALRPYIPGAVIHRILAGQSDWLAELRKVTIVIMNFPELGQQTSLEAAQEIMRTIQRLVYRYEGSINKISQDDKGVMIDAVFGLPPLMHTDDPARAIRSAMLIRTEMQARGLRGSIGVATGRVFCGLVGTRQRRVYTLLGHTVNLTARLMGLTSRPELGASLQGIAVLCDRATYEAAKEHVEFEQLPSQKVKGRSERVDVFQPLHEKTGVLHAPSELIGRGDEKALLVNGLQELQRGVQFQAIVLHGEAGIGKSRLMEELLQQAQISHVKTFFAETDPVEKNNPYFAWRAIFNRVFEIEPFTERPQLSTQDRAAIQAAVMEKLAQVDPEFVRYAPLLSVILPVSIPDNEFTSVMTGEVRGGNIRDLLVRLLQHEADQTPILIAMEDLHWFDFASWTLFADIYQRVRPLLLVVDTRPLSMPVPQEFKELAQRADTKFLKLDMLSLDEVEALVCQRLRVQSLPAEVAKLIRDKSEGHPFFAEELAYALRDTGVLLIEGGTCWINPDVTQLETLTLPDTLEAAITSRIDGLSPSQQLTLKVASVIGRIFAYRALEAIHPIENDKPALPAYLEALTRLQLTLIESETPDLAYIFKHAVTREVAYNLMLFSQRRQLHQAVAEWIERDHGRELDSFYTLLAYHWKQAASMPDAASLETARKKAVEYLEKAGDQSLRNFANAEAVQFFGEALQLADTARMSRLRLGQWYRKMGEAYLGLGKIVEAKQYIALGMGTLGLPLSDSNARLLGAFLKQVVRQGAHRFWPARFRNREFDPTEEKTRMEIVHLCDLLGIVQFLNGDPNPLPMLFGVLAGLNTAETMKETPELWSAYASVSAVAGFIPLPSEARYYKERWKALGQKIDRPDSFVRGVVSLCTVSSGNGEWQEVKDLVEKAFVICNELGDHRQAGDAIAYLDVNTLLEGGPNLWKPYNQRMWEVAMRRENPIHIAFAYQTECTALVWTGQFEECIAAAQKCLALSEKSWVGDIPEYIARSAMWLALWQKGEREGVWEPVKAALEKFSKASVVDFSAYLIHSHLAETAFLALEQARKDHLPQAQTEEIEKYAALAIKNLKKYVGVFAIGAPALERYKGQWEWHHGRSEKAYQLWQAAIDKAHALPISYEEGRAHLLLGQYLPLGDPGRARHVQWACEIFAGSGYQNWAAIAGSAASIRLQPA